MKKKAQFIITLAIFVSVVLSVASVIIIDNELKESSKVQYTGDNSTKIVYNIKSKNPECNLNNILIYKNDVIYLENLEHAHSKNYTIDAQCN